MRRCMTRQQTDTIETQPRRCAWERNKGPDRRVTQTQQEPAHEPERSGRRAQLHQHGSRGRSDVDVASYVGRGDGGVRVRIQHDS